MATTTTLCRPSRPADTTRELHALPSVDRLLLDCHCGQALDVRQTGHCPRCGVTLASLGTVIGAR